MAGTRKKIPTVLEFSAGGVVYRKGPAGLEIAVIRVGDRYALPKGLIEKGESPEQAAVREVQEETGLEVEPQGLLDKIDYWFVWPDESGRKVRHHKVVYFYLMACVGGDPARHDFEVDEVLWLPAPEALARLSYKTERAVLQKALDRLAGAGSDPASGSPPS